MGKPKAHAVVTKANKRKILPSLLRKSKTSGQSAARALIPFQKRTHLKATKSNVPPPPPPPPPPLPLSSPPVENVTTDQRQDKISDLTNPVQYFRDKPPIKQIEAANQSATSSLSQSTMMGSGRLNTHSLPMDNDQKRNDALGKSVHVDETLETMYQPQPVQTAKIPITPHTKTVKAVLELAGGLKLKAPSPVGLDRVMLQRQQDEDDGNLEYRVPLKSPETDVAVNDIEILDTSDAYLKRQLSPATDMSVAISQASPKKGASELVENDSSASEHRDNSKGMSFSKVKALLSFVNSNSRVVPGIAVSSADPKEKPQLHVVEADSILKDGDDSANFVTSGQSPSATPEATASIPVITVNTRQSHDTAFLRIPCSPPGLALTARAQRPSPPASGSKDSARIRSPPLETRNTDATHIQEEEQEPLVRSSKRSNYVFPELAQTLISSPKPSRKSASASPELALSKKSSHEVRELSSTSPELAKRDDTKAAASSYRPRGLDPEDTSCRIPVDAPDFGEQHLQESFCAESEDGVFSTEAALAKDYVSVMGIPVVSGYQSLNRDELSDDVSSKDLSQNPFVEGKDLAIEGPFKFNPFDSSVDTTMSFGQKAVLTKQDEQAALSFEFNPFESSNGSSSRESARKGNNPFEDDTSSDEGIPEPQSSISVPKLPPKTMRRMSTGRKAQPGRPQMKSDDEKQNSELKSKNILGEKVLNEPDGHADPINRKDEHHNSMRGKVFPEESSLEKARIHSRVDNFQAETEFKSFGIDKTWTGEGSISTLESEQRLNRYHAERRKKAAPAALADSLSENSISQAAQKVLQDPSNEFVKHEEHTNTPIPLENSHYSELGVLHCAERTPRVSNGTKRDDVEETSKHDNDSEQAELSDNVVQERKEGISGGLVARRRHFFKEEGRRSDAPRRALQPKYSISSKLQSKKIGNNFQLEKNQSAIRAFDTTGKKSSDDNVEEEREGIIDQYNMLELNSTETSVQEIVMQLSAQSSREELQQAHGDSILQRILNFGQQATKLSPASKTALSSRIDEVSPTSGSILKKAIEKAKVEQSNQVFNNDLQSSNLKSGDKVKQAKVQLLDRELQNSIKHLNAKSEKTITLLLEEKTPNLLSVPHTSDRKINRIFKNLRSSTLSQTTLATMTKPQADDAIDLLSQLEELSVDLKDAAKKSKEKAQEIGAENPVWSKALIDLTGVGSYDDLLDEEAVWLFDLDTCRNGKHGSPKSDFDSLIEFAAKKLGISRGDQSGSTFDMNNTRARAAAALTQQSSDTKPSATEEDEIQSGFTEALSPFSLLRQKRNLVRPRSIEKIKAQERQKGNSVDLPSSEISRNDRESSMVSARTVDKDLEKDLYEICNSEDGIVSDQSGYEIVQKRSNPTLKGSTQIGLPVSPCSSAKHESIDASLLPPYSLSSTSDSDRYKAFDLEDKYATIADRAGSVGHDKPERKRLMPSESTLKTSTIEKESEVSSSDGYSTLLAKIKRDAGEQTVSLTSSGYPSTTCAQATYVASDTEGKATSRSSPSSDIAARRDFLEILFDTTESILCGTRRGEKEASESTRNNRNNTAMNGSGSDHNKTIAKSKMRGSDVLEDTSPAEDISLQGKKCVVLDARYTGKNMNSTDKRPGSRVSHQSPRECSPKYNLSKILDVSSQESTTTEPTPFHGQSEGQRTVSSEESTTTEPMPFQAHSDGLRRNVSSHESTATEPTPFRAESKTRSVSSQESAAIEEIQFRSQSDALSMSSRESTYAEPMPLLDHLRALSISPCTESMPLLDQLRALSISPRDSKEPTPPRDIQLKDPSISPHERRQDFVLNTKQYSPSNSEKSGVSQWSAIETKDVPDSEQESSSHHSVSSDEISQLRQKNNQSRAVSQADTLGGVHAGTVSEELLCATNVDRSNKMEENLLQALSDTSGRANTNFFLVEGHRVPPRPEELIATVVNVLPKSTKRSSLAPTPEVSESRCRVIAHDTSVMGRVETESSNQAAQYAQAETDHQSCEELDEVFESTVSLSNETPLISHFRAETTSRSAEAREGKAAGIAKEKVDVAFLKNTSVEQNIVSQESDPKDAAVEDHIMLPDATELSDRCVKVSQSEDAYDKKIIICENEETTYERDVMKEESTKGLNADNECTSLKTNASQVQECLAMQSKTSDKVSIYNDKIMVQYAGSTEIGLKTSMSEIARERIAVEKDVTPTSRTGYVCSFEKTNAEPLTAPATGVSTVSALVGQNPLMASTEELLNEQKRATESSATLTHESLCHETDFEGDRVHPSIHNDFHSNSGDISQGRSNASTDVHLVIDNVSDSDERSSVAQSETYKTHHKNVIPCVPGIPGHTIRYNHELRNAAYYGQPTRASFAKTTNSSEVKHASELGTRPETPIRIEDDFDSEAMDNEPALSLVPRVTSTKEKMKADGRLQDVNSDSVAIDREPALILVPSAISTEEKMKADGSSQDINTVSVAIDNDVCGRPDAPIVLYDELDFEPDGTIISKPPLLSSLANPSECLFYDLCNPGKLRFRAASLAPIEVAHQFGVHSEVGDTDCDVSPAIHCFENDRTNSDATLHGEPTSIFIPSLESHNENTEKTDEIKTSRSACQSPAADISEDHLSESVATGTDTELFILQTLESSDHISQKELAENHSCDTGDLVISDGCRNGSPNSDSTRIMSCGDMKSQLEEIFTEHVKQQTLETRADIPIEISVQCQSECEELRSSHSRIVQKSIETNQQSIALTEENVGSPYIPSLLVSSSVKEDNIESKNVEEIDFNAINRLSAKALLSHEESFQEIDQSSVYSIGVNSDCDEPASLLLALTRSEADTNIEYVDSNSSDGSDTLLNNCEEVGIEVGQAISADDRPLDQATASRFDRVRELASRYPPGISRSYSAESDVRSVMAREFPTSPLLSSLMRRLTKKNFDNESGSVDSDPLDAEAIYSKHNNANLATNVSKEANKESFSSINNLEIDTTEAATVDSTDDPVDVDELFLRYDAIVQHMVILDDEKLAKVQARQMNSIVEAADLAVRKQQASFDFASIDLSGPASHSVNKKDEESSPRRLANRERSNRHRRIASLSPLRLRRSASANSGSPSTPSRKAFNLRQKLQKALKGSVIENDVTRIVPFSDAREAGKHETELISPAASTASAPSLIANYSGKSYYHRKCVNPNPSSNSNTSPIARIRQRHSRLVSRDIKVSSHSDHRRRSAGVAEGKSQTAIASPSVAESVDSDTAMEYSDDECEEVQQHRIESIMSGLRRAELSLHSK